VKITVWDYFIDELTKVDPLKTHHEQGADWTECIFCGSGYDVPHHKPSCIWLMAQDVRK
jgi:hypothetical protein